METVIPEAWPQMKQKTKKKPMGKSTFLYRQMAKCDVPKQQGIRNLLEEQSPVVPHASTLGY